MSDQVTGPRAIMHVDMDAFFASVEQRDRPELRDAPVIVGGTGNRGVVAAASYEARRFGVRSAMPTRRARELCPDGHYLRPRFADYKQASEDIFAIFRRYTPEVQGLSLDEAFLDLTGTERSHGGIEWVGREVKRRIQEEVNLIASVGMAPNKFLAKLASDHDKPDGFCLVAVDEIRGFLDPLPIRRMWGVGPSAGERLTGLGIHTIGDLHRCPETVLRSALGLRSASRLKALAAGVDDRPVIESAMDKSISCEETYDKDLAGWNTIKHALTELCERLAPRLSRANVLGHVVTVKIRTPDFTTKTRQRRVTPALSSIQAIRAVACDLLRIWHERNPNSRVRLLGVGLSDLQDQAQPDLFASDQLERQDQLENAVAEMRERWGDEVIKRGGFVRKKGASDDTLA